MLLQRIPTRNARFSVIATLHTAVVVTYIFKQNMHFTQFCKLFFLCISPMLGVNYSIDGSKVSIPGGYLLAKHFGFLSAWALP